jgi:hypothetical protein
MPLAWQARGLTKKEYRMLKNPSFAMNILLYRSLNYKLSFEQHNCHSLENGSGEL